jgi:branched-chain amino acid transport system substrate-binding protein
MFSKPMTKRAIPAAAGLIAVALLAGACGSSSSSSGATTTPVGSGASSTSSSGVSAGGSTESGSTITIGGFDSLSNPEYSAPETKAGLQAAIADVNAHGGINGHMLKLDFCNSQYIANDELACTRQLVGAKVSALVAPSILADLTGREYTVASAAGVPIIGTQGLTPPELTSSVTFPASSGIPGWAYGAADALVAQGIRKINILTDTNGSSQYFASFIAAGLKSAGITPQIVTADPNSDPTFSTAAAKVTQGAGGIIMCPSPVNIPKILQAIHQTSYTGKLASISALFPPAILKAVGPLANGILLSSQMAFTTDTANGGVRQFLTDMKSNNPSAAVDNTSETAWTAVMLYATVARQDKAYDAASVLNAFKTLSTPINVGTLAPFKVVGAEQPLPQYTRIFNPTVQIGSVVNGNVEANGKGFVNPFTSLTKSAS